MNKHNQKHLTLSNRTYIEQELLQKSTFSSIAKSLHKDPTTISKEVKRYYKTIPARDSLNGATPFDLAALLLDKKIPALAGQFKVSPDKVMLKPALIENSVKEREARHE